MEISKEALVWLAANASIWVTKHDSGYSAKTFGVDESAMVDEIKKGLGSTEENKVVVNKERPVKKRKVDLTFLRCFSNNLSSLLDEIEAIDKKQALLEAWEVDLEKRERMMSCTKAKGDNRVKQLVKREKMLDEREKQLNILEREIAMQTPEVSYGDKQRNIIDEIENILNSK
jgi:hypothetical protein